MKHDENKDIKLLSQIAKIDERMKTIQIQKSQPIGNKRWGRLDFLTNHCGYKIIWNSAVIVNPYQNKKDNDDNNNKVKEKKEAHKLTNKNSKNNKKK